MSADNVNPYSDLDLGVTVRGLVPGQKVLKRYTLERVLGRGGMGVVWLAYDEMLTRKVALKFLPEVLAKDRSALEELKREAKRSLELSHPNIVRFYDFLQDELCAGISMEYVAGDSLANLRVDQPNKVFEAADLQNWMRQLCQALQYAHDEVQIVHRDLKPANLMVDAQGRLKVTDFGIARSVSESVSRATLHKGGGSVAGTLVYMSPQQAMGEPPSIQDDIYSLGATVYELLTSKPPFYSGEILAQVREKTPPPLHQRRRDLHIEGKKIPLNWEKTIASCLQKEPAKRPTSAWEVMERLGLESRGPRGPMPKAASAIPVEPELETTLQTKAEVEGETLEPKPSDKKSTTHKRPPSSRGAGMLIEIETEIGGMLPELPPEKPKTAPPKTAGKEALPPTPPPPKPALPLPLGGEGRGEGEKAGELRTSNVELPTPNLQPSTLNAQRSTEKLPLGGEGRGEGEKAGELQTSNVELPTPNLQPSTLNAQRSTEEVLGEKENRPPETTKPPSTAPAPPTEQPVVAINPPEPPITLVPPTEGRAREPLAPPAPPTTKPTTAAPPPPTPPATPPTAAPATPPPTASAPPPPPSTATGAPPIEAATPPSPPEPPPTEIKPPTERPSIPAEPQPPPAEQPPPTEIQLPQESPPTETASTAPAEAVTPEPVQTPAPIIEPAPEPEAEPVVEPVEEYQPETAPGRGKQRLLATLKVLVALALLAGLGWGGWIGWQAYQEKKYPAGALFVEVQPPAATVKLFVKEGVQPRELRSQPGAPVYSGLAPGDYILVATHDGYEAVTNIISLTQKTGTALAQSRRETIALKLQTGGLLADITPRDAAYEVTAVKVLSGKPVPKSTHKASASLNDLPLGDYAVRIFRESYRSETTNITIVPEVPAKLQFALARAKGTVTITTSPVGADYTLIGPDGTERKGKTTATETNLPTGAYLLSLNFKDYSELKTNVTVTDSAIVNATYSLPRAMGTLTFSSPLLAAATYSLAGPMNQQGELKTPFSQKLPTGNYELVVASPTYFSKTIAVEIVAETPKDLGAIKLQGITGLLLISANPRGTMISVDKSEPFMMGAAVEKRELPVGAHQIIAKLTGYDDRTESVSVTTNQPTPISITLARSAGTLKFAFSPPTATNLIRYAPNPNNPLLPGTNLVNVKSGTIITLPTGSYVVELGDEHHQPITRSFEILANQPTDLGSLVLQHYRGGVEIAFFPTNALAEIGERNNPDLDFATNTTPGRLAVAADKLPIGPYPLRISQPGFITHTSLVSITAGQVTPLAKVELPRQTGRINVSVAHPVQVQVSVSGPQELLPGDQPIAKSGVTKEELAQLALPTGVYKVWVEAKGYEPATNNQVVIAADSKNGEADFKSLTRSMGSLYVDTQPSNARFKIYSIKPDAEEPPNLPPQTAPVEMKLETGTYVIEATMPRTIKWSADATNIWQTVKEVRVQRNQLTNEILAFPFCAITVETEPPGAIISQGGKVLRKLHEPPKVLQEFGVEEKALFEARLPGHKPTNFWIDSGVIGLIRQTNNTAPRVPLIEWPGPQAGEKFWTNSLGMIFRSLNATSQVFISVYECRIKDYMAASSELRQWKALQANTADLRAAGFEDERYHDFLPVFNVTWQDANRFCEELTRSETKSHAISPNHRYRLPTDLEWSQAAGLDETALQGLLPKDRHLKQRDLYPWGRQWPPPPDAGNYPTALTFDRYQQMAPVGMFRPNALGLFDLGGNVWEWCADNYDETGSSKVLRGNAWDWAPGVLIEEAMDTCNTSYRYHEKPTAASPLIGFRCVIDTGEK